MTRRYDSPVREERAKKTREALLDACEALLLEGQVEEVTLPAVARRAGVTKPTAYSHFPDLDSLMAGFLDHVRGRIGMEHETLAALAPAELAAATRQNFARFESNARLLRRLMDSPSYERVRVGKKADRAGMVLAMWRTETSASDEELRARLGALYLLVSPTSWRWLRETWGLSADDAAHAAAWAMGSLVSALGAAPTKTVPRTRSRKRKPS